MSDIIVGGLSDKDVTVNLPNARVLTQNQVQRQMVAVVEDQPSASRTSPPTRRSAARAANTPSPTSCAFDSLPTFAKAAWHTSFVPTLLDLAGSWCGKDGGWEIEKDKEAFRIMILDTAAKVYPNVVYGLTTNCTMYHMVSAVLIWMAHTNHCSCDL